MPSRELFLKQDPDYQENVLPSWCLCRVSIEAGTTFGWERFVGIDGLTIGLDHFGASAPYKVLAEKFGFTPEGVLEGSANTSSAPMRTTRTSAVAAAAKKAAARAIAAAADPDRR
jgi:transketolase